MKARENPFRSERLLALRYRLSDDEWAALIERLEALGNRAALVGARGAGKTTLLRDIGARLEARGFAVARIRLNEAAPSVSGRGWVDLARARGFVLLDGAERLGAARWRAFSVLTRRAAGIVVTSHEPSRLPTLTVCETSAELLAGLAEELLGERPPWLDATARTLFEKHAGNLREALRDLYDRYAAQQ
jgi:hypothetical protein